MRIRSSGGVQSESCRHGGRASRGAPPVLLETILAESPHHHCARIVAANDKSPCKIKLKKDMPDTHKGFQHKFEK